MTEEHPHKAADRPGLTGRLRAWVRDRPLRWRLAVPVACACAGLLATTSMINARGTDLRGGRHTDLIGVVGEQRQSVQDLRRSVRDLQAEVENLADQVTGGRIDEVREQIAEMETPAGLQALTGPGVSVTLDDAPNDQEVPDGVNPNLFVVHQQDLQAVVNALWAGGADAISLQGQRIISTTGIKCVGNTVVLQGVPYAPPYRIEAIGDASLLTSTMLADPGVIRYLEYTAEPFNLTWNVRDEDELTIGAYEGSLTMSYASPS